MGDKKTNIRQLRLAYASTEGGGDGQFHERDRATPYDPLAERDKLRKRPRPVRKDNEDDGPAPVLSREGPEQTATRTRTRRPYNLNAGCSAQASVPPAPYYLGQEDVKRFERRLDDAIDFDLRLDHVFATMQDIFEFRLMFPFRNPGTKNGPAMMAVQQQIRRVAMLPDGEWHSNALESHKAGLQEKHDRKWSDFLSDDACYTNLRHCTPEGLRDIAISMLFRDQRKRGDLEGARALVDFMDARHAKGLPPVTRDRQLYDFPVRIGSEYPPRRPYGRTDEGDVKADCEWEERQWPYDWVMRDDHATLLGYMIDRKSCLLVPTLEVTGLIVKSYFGPYPRHFVHGREPRSKLEINMSEDFSETSHPLAHMPGSMRHQVERACAITAPDIQQAARSALQEIDAFRSERFEDIEEERRDLRKRAKRERTIWSPFEPG